MRLRNQDRPEAEFQMAPMIDMVFLLIVFFLYAGSQAQAHKAKEVELPESESSEVADDLKNRAMVTVEADGSVYFGQEAITLDKLEVRLRSVLLEVPELQVTLRIEKTTPYRATQKVLAVCQEASANKVIIATLQAD